VNAAGVAPAGDCGRSRSNIDAPPREATSAGVTVHAGSDSVPAWPAPVAAMRVNVTEPRFASGSGRQNPRALHWAGASKIHSAEDRSGAAKVSRFVTLVRRVRFSSWRSTFVPETFTEAVIVSPGTIFSRSSTGGAGTGSSHAR
jgi:hypothetical protein